MCQSNTTNLYYIFIVLGQHVSILIESSSGPSKKIDPYLELLNALWDLTAHFNTEWPKKMYTLFTHQYLWNKFK